MLQGVSNCMVIEYLNPTRFACTRSGLSRHREQV